MFLQKVPPTVKAEGMSRATTLLTIGVGVQFSVNEQDLPDASLNRMNIPNSTTQGRSSLGWAIRCEPVN